MLAFKTALMKRFILFLLCISGLLFSGCDRNVITSTSNVNFQLKAAISPINGATINWNAGSAGVYSAKILGKKNDSSSVEFASTPNINIDLFGMLNITSVAIPKGTYRNVQFKMELHDIGGKPQLHLEGTYTAAGISTPISFDASSTLFISAAKDSIVIDANTSNYTAITTVGLGTLTSGVTEADLKAADRTAGKIVISASSNILVYNKIIANLAKNQIIEFK